MSYKSIESDDGVERGAQFVTDVCQEPAVCCRCVAGVLTVCCSVLRNQAECVVRD